MSRQLAIAASVVTLGMLMILGPEARGQAWRDEVPNPVYDQQPELVDFYWKTWELAHDHVLTQPGLPQSTYMDEAFDPGVIWIWDTAFMAHFTKYAPNHFPGVESFQNFYVPLHDNTPQQNESYPLKIQHPDNPPLFAWGEHANFKLVGGAQRIADLLQQQQYLQQHFEWFDSVSPGTRLPSANGDSVGTSLQRVNDAGGRLKGYRWNGVSSGMDNTPRGRDVGWSNLLWIDAISQQALSAKCIVELASAVGDTAVAAEYQAKYDTIKSVVNELYWDEEDGFYYDIHRDSTPGAVTFSKVKTPASYWPLLAGLASPEQAARMAEHVQDPAVFGGDVPWTTLARNDPEFRSDGGYWRGGVWLPTAYMGVKALEQYGYDDLASQTASDLVQHMLQTYQQYDRNPGTPEVDGTVWEYYDPDEPRPGQNQNARPDFTGWSALGPISLFIENVIGIEADAQAGEVNWRLATPGRVGVEGFHFGGVTADIVALGDGSLTVDADASFRLNVKSETFEVPAGLSTFTFVTGLRGDLDRNGLLEEDDVQAFIAGWGVSSMGLSAVDAYGQGDMNYDGQTDLHDWSLFRRAMIDGGQAALIRGVQTPEPHTGMMIVVPLSVAAYVRLQP